MSQVKAYMIEGFESKCIQDKCFDRSLASFKKEKAPPSGFMLGHMYGGVFVHWGGMGGACPSPLLLRKDIMQKKESKSKEEQ